MPELDIVKFSFNTITMYKLGIAAIVVSFTLFISCSSNSTNSDETEEVTSNGSFTVSGDMEENFEGASYFTVLKNNSDILQIQIHLVDTHPIDRDDTYDPQYSLVLTADLEGEPISMSTGSYEIGTLSDDDILFSGVFTIHTSSSYQHQNGSVTITSYSDDQIEASFELTSIDFAQGASSEEDKVISISGDFSAECYGFNC
ncbi:MAG: hypothetical protein WD053_01430 [Gracilimonas sp.]